MKKQTYHSNSRYKVCAKIITNDAILCDESIKVRGNVLEMIDTSEEFIDKYSFSLNKIFEPQDKKSSSQEYCIQNVVSLITDKSNGCIISYGPTNSGKSSTIFGLKGQEESLLEKTIQYFLKHKDQKTKIFIGYLDLYINNIIDLAKVYQQVKNNERVTINYETSTLNVKIDYERITVENQTKIEIKTQKDLIDVLEVCEKFKRSQNNDDLNLFQDCSSIVQFFIQFDEQENKAQSILSIVELASFRQVAKINMIGKHLKKNINIKNNLINLRQCLQAIAQSNENLAPFKDSQLSKILKHSIDQDSYIILMTHVHIYDGFNFEDQLNSLFFSDKTRKLINLQKNKEKKTNKNSNQLIMVEDKTKNKLEEEMKILTRNLAQKKFELDQQNKNFKDNYDVLKNLLGLSFDIQNMMSKNLDKERRQFDQKKEAIIKIEQINLQIDEILNEKDAIIQKFDDIKKEEFQKQEKLLQLMIEQKDLNRFLNDQIQQNNFLNEQNLKDLQNDKNQLINKLSLDNQKLAKEKSLLVSNIPKNKNFQSSTCRSVRRSQEIDDIQDSSKKELHIYIKQYQESLDIQAKKTQQELQNKVKEIEQAQQQSNQYFHKKEQKIQQINQELLEQYGTVKKQFDILDKIQNGLYCSKNQTIYIPDIPEKPTRTEYLHLFKVIDQKNYSQLNTQSQRKIQNPMATFQAEFYLQSEKFRQQDIQTLQDKLKQNLQIEQQLVQKIRDYQQKALKLDVIDLKKDSKKLKNLYEQELKYKDEINQKFSSQRLGNLDQKTSRKQQNPMAQSCDSGFPTLRNSILKQTFQN